MTSEPADPALSSLNELVFAGQLTPEQAAAAYAVGRQTGAPRELRLDTAGVAFGSGLVTVAVLLSTIYSRRRPGLDWSNFSMGTLATLGLLAVACAAYLLVRDLERRANLTAWPGAFGAISAGLMISVALDDNDATWYAAGLAVVALSVAGYYLVRRGAFVLSTIAGLLVLYANLFDDFFGIDDLADDNYAMVASVAILVFAAGVTAAGWSLPTRNLSGVTVGAAAVLANLAVLYALFLSRLFSAIGEGSGSGSFDSFDNDVWVMILISLVMCAGWAYCSWLTGHIGYSVLIVADLVSVIPLATIVLTVEHPTYWGLAVGFAGAAVLAIVGLRAIGAARQAVRATSA